jgi:hypothetical protein
MSSNPENINISKDNIQGKCDLKCYYVFKYNNSNITAKNRGVMLSFTYDNSNTPPVIYNNEKYTVSKFFITCPSIHTFNNELAVGEIIIEHIPVAGGNQFNVAIPFTASSEATTATNLITELINSVASNAPSQGESVNVNISNFTLQNIVPKKPFYSYTDSSNSDWIVFDIQNAIPLSSATLSTLGTIIKPFSITTDGNGLFYNSTGPNASSINVSEGIYISCQPTGSSGETAVLYDTNTTNYNLRTLFSTSGGSIFLQIILGVVAFIMLFVGLNYLYSYLTSDPQKIKIANSFKFTNPFKKQT